MSVPSSAPPLQADTTGSDSATTSFTTVQGTIEGTTSGEFVVSTTTGAGDVPVTTSGAAINTDGGSLATGHYAIVLGKGTSTIAATYVAVFSSAPGSITLSGTVLGATAYGLDLSTTSDGEVPVLVSSATTGSYTVGSSATVTGTGSGAVAVLAKSITAGSATTTAASSGSSHILTGDYLGTPWGSTSVSASRAAPYLSYAITDPSNGNADHAAGIKTMAYVSPLLVQSNDPLYTLSASSGFATTCSGSRISYDYSGTTQWVMNPAASALQSAYESLVTSFEAAGHVDYVYLDDAGPIASGRTLSPGDPCDYSATTWESNVGVMQSKLSVPAIINGLNNYSETALAPEMTLIGKTGFSGGNLEACFASSDLAEQGSWPWTQTEQSQIDTTNDGQLFQCMVEDHTTASSATASRIYTLASFLMTYNQTHSVLFDEYASPSGVDVMPESQLVPTEPLVSQPSSIQSLEKGTWTYAREYKACYYKGELVGQCAMVVNADTSSQPTPALTQSYKHTLALSGNGVLDGGTASLTGSAPPTTMAATSAFIALP